MDSLRKLVVRDDSIVPSFTPTTVSLLIALLVLVIFGMVCLGALLILKSVRRKREAREQQLPTHYKRGHKRSLTITTTPYGRHSRTISINEKVSFLSNSPPGSPASPVPEIRITFPEEEDHSGKRQSRVVVVRINENGGYGLEPYEETLPPYQQRDNNEWKSLDLERIGGLKEKEQTPASKWS